MFKKLFATLLIFCFVSHIITCSALAVTVKTLKAPKPVVASGIGEVEDVLNAVDIFLDEIEGFDTSGSPMATALKKKLLGAQSAKAKRLKKIAESYLPEIAAVGDIDVAAGCMPEWLAAGGVLFVATPVIVYFALDALVDDDLVCVGGYATWSLTSLSVGLSLWIDYRVCEEENSADPDQATLDKLQEDKVFLRNMASVSLVLSLVNTSICDEELFPDVDDIWDN
jgi:hypothetical protein